MEKEMLNICVYTSTIDELVKWDEETGEREILTPHDMVYVHFPYHMVRDFFYEKIYADDYREWLEPTYDTPEIRALKKEDVFDYWIKEVYICDDTDDLYSYCMEKGFEIDKDDIDEEKGEWFM